MVGAAGFEPTTTSPPGSPIACAGVRWRRMYARTGHMFRSRFRGPAPLLVTTFVSARFAGTTPPPALAIHSARRGPLSRWRSWAHWAGGALRVNPELAVVPVVAIPCDSLSGSLGLPGFAPQLGARGIDGPAPERAVADRCASGLEDALGTGATGHECGIAFAGVARSSQIPKLPRSERPRSQPPMIVARHRPIRPSSASLRTSGP